MTRPSVRQILVTTLLLVAIYLPGTVRAGTGSAVSGSAAIDTRLPAITVDNLPPNALYQAGETITFSWFIAEDNPSSNPSANIAEIWFGDTFYEVITFSPANGHHNWQWTVPDITSGTTHLVVGCTDGFGNTSTDRNADFTILSATTDVPGPNNLTVFAPPSPNPFNPLTQLRFNLPADGPIQVTVHDARGFQVNSLRQGYQPAGPLTLQWNGTDSAGRRQAGGTYFFRLVYRNAGQAAQVVHKAVLLP